jgi:antitoxin MazE9
VKLSVSLPDEDIAYIDDYAHRSGAPSRSSVLHKALALLRLSELESAYASAWEEWRASGDHEVWSSTTGDGLRDAPR